MSIVNHRTANSTLSFACETLTRRTRLILSMGLWGALAGFAFFCFAPRLYHSSTRIQFVPQFHPGNAVTAAEYDIRNGHLMFYFIGSIAPSAPGVPEKYAYLTLQYPRGLAGANPGCTGSTGEECEYARRYNQRILQHLTQ
jgi:hypothetical protein